MIKFKNRNFNKNLSALNYQGTNVILNNIH